MFESPLSKHAGPIAALAGGLFAVIHVGLFLAMDRSDLAAMVADPVFTVFNAAYFVAFPLLLIALVALYWRQAGQAGAFGAVAFCIAAAGTMALAGDMWFEGFAVPWIAPKAPELFAAERDGLLLAAWLVSVVLFSLGWILFGFASLRARVLPRSLSVAVAVGGLLGFQAAMPPWGCALGLAVAGAGVWLIRHDGSSRAVQTRAGDEPIAVAASR